MIGKLTSSIARTFALALTICATGGASAAVKPLAVWNGDFVDGVERGGFYLQCNGNTISLDGSYISIKESSSGGVIVTNSTYTARPMTVIAAFEDLSIGGNNIALATSMAYWSKAGSDPAAYYNRTGLSLKKDDSKFYGWWNNSGNITTMQTGAIYDSTDVTSVHLNLNTSVSRHYIAYCYTTTTYGYDNGGQVYYKSALTAGDDQGVYGFSVGGLFNSAANNATDAKIKYLAILKSNSATDIAAWSPTSMTSVTNLATATTLSASDNATLETQGINLPANGCITVNGAVTVAAVFSQGDSEIRFADANSSLTVSGPVYVAGENTLTLVPVALSANGSKTLISASVIGSASNISVNDPTETDAIYWHEIGDTSVSIGRGTLALDYTATPGGGFASGLGSTWMSSFSYASPAALRVGPNGTTLPYTYEVTSGNFNPYSGLAGRTLPISFSIYADLSAAGSANYAIMAFGTKSNGLVLYHSVSKVRVGRFTNSNVDGSFAEIAKPIAGYHLYTVTCAADGTIKLYLDDGAVSGTGSMTTKTAFATGFQVGSIFGENISWMYAGDKVAVAKIMGWEGVLSPENVATLAGTYPATTGEIDRNISFNASDKTLKVYSSAQKSGVNAILGVDAGTINIPAGETVTVTTLRTDASNASADANNVTIAGRLNVTGSDTTIGSNAENASVCLGYYLTQTSGTRTTSVTISSGGVLNAPNAYLQMPWATQCQGATLSIDGEVKVKGLYSYQSGKGTVTLANGGTLEVAEILSTGQAITKNFRYGTFRVTADAEETRAVNFSAASGYATTLDPNGHTLTMAAAAMTGLGAVTVGGSNGGKVLFNGFTSSYRGAIQFSDANKHMIEVTSWDNFAGSLTGTLTIDDTNKDMLGGIPWDKFTGTLKYEVTSGTLDLSAYDMSACTINVTGTGATIVLRTGQEGNLTVGENSTVELLVTEDKYKHDGYVLSGTVNGTLKYKYTADAGVSYSEVANDAYNGTNLIPYYQLFNVSNGASGGYINTASNWGGGVVPTGRNAAFYVNSAEGITVTVDRDITFGDIQVYGSGIVTFVGTDGHKLSCANLDIASGVTVKIDGTSDSEALNVSNGKISGGGSLEILSGAKMVLDGVTYDNPMTVSGMLQTKGTTNLSGLNTFSAGSLLDVVSGSTTTIGAAYDGIKGNVTIASAARLNISKAHLDQDPIDHNGNSILDIAGTLDFGGNFMGLGEHVEIRLREGGRIEGSPAHANYGTLGWRAGGVVHAYGNATINAPIRIKNDVAVTFSVEDGATLSITKAFETTGSGNADWTAGGSIVKTGNGILKLHNVAMTVPISGSEGTLELLCDGNASADVLHTATSSFSGALVITRLGSNKYPVFGDDAANSAEGQNLILTGEPTTAVTGDWILNYRFAGNYLTVSDLSGSGNFRCDYGTYSTQNPRYLKTRQKAENGTTFSGVIMKPTGATRKLGLVVESGVSSAVRSLTLSNTSTTDGPLIIQDYGKVIFSGSGSWLYGDTTVKENGVIESQMDAKVAGTVTLESGSTVSIVKVDGARVPFTATKVNLPATGTVKVDLSAAGITSGSGATPIMKCAVNDTGYINNLSTVGYDGEGAFSYDDTNKQIVFTPTAMEEWTYGSATWASASVTDNGSNTITYHDDISDVVFGAIASTPATITLDGKRTPASVTFNGGANTTYVIAGGSFEPVGTVTISSGTVKIDTDATLSVVTGSGTLEIGAGRTVTLTSATALDDITSLTGTGTLVLPAGAAPSTSGLTTLLSNANWHGTLVVSSITGNVERDFAAWGNSNSNIKMVGVEGKTKTSTEAAERTVAAGVVLDNGDGDFALKFTSILSGNQSTWTKISGSGTIVLEGDDQQVFEIRDSSGFTGSVSQQANAGRLSFVNNKGSEFKSGRGMITVYDDNNTEAYIGSGATWTAGNNGIQILGTLVIKGDATLDSVSDSAKITIVNNAKLRYDSLGTLTLSNAVQVVQSLDNNLNTSGIGTVTIAFGDGATLRNGAKLIDWSAAGLSEPPAGTFQISDANSEAKTNYVLVKTSSGLFLTSGVAVVNGTTAYATLQAAIDASGDNDVIRLLGNNTESITVALGRTLKIAKGSYTCNAPAPVDGWPTLSSDPDGDGVTTYKTPAAMRTRGETAKYHATFDDAMTDVESGDTVTMRLAISASAVTKSIPSGVTVNLVDSATSNALFDNVTFTGSGTVELKAFPSDTTSRVDNSWTGTVVFPAAGDVRALDTKLNAWGNDNSKIQLHSVGTTGSKGQGEGTWSPGTVNPTIEILSGATVILNNGNNGATGVFTTLSGAGTLQLDWNKSGTTYNQKINKLDGFTGTLKTEQSTQKFIIGEIALAAQPNNGDKVVKMVVTSVDRIDLTTASLTVNGTPVTDMIPDMRLYKKTDGVYASQPYVSVGGVEYFSLDEALANAGSGQTITLLRDLEYAPAGSVEIGNLDVGNCTLTLTTRAADQVISVTNLAGTGYVIVNSSENPGVGRVAFTGENTGFTGSITVAVGGTLVAESAVPWKASSETSQGMASVTVNGTLMLTHGAYMNGIVLKQVTWGASSRLELVDSVHADGSITVSNDYANGVPETRDVVDIYRVALDGVTKTSNDVSQTDTYTYKPHISGSACLLDFTFTNTVRVVSGTNRIFAASTSQWKDPVKYSLKTDWDGSDTVVNFLAPGGTGKTKNGEMWPVYTNYVDTVEPHQYTALHGLIRPFRGTDDSSNEIPVYFLPKDRPCSAFVAGTIPSAPHTCFVSFGSTRGGIFLATGDTPDELDLIYLNSTENEVNARVNFRKEHCTKLTTMRVPYGDAAQHTVVFETSDHQTYDIYLDGELWTRYSFPERIEIKHGFHVGSWIGGDNEAEGFYRKIDVDTAPNSYVSAIRIYDTALGANAIAALAEEFPYVSPGVGYERILTTSETTESWSQANAWRNVAESEEFTETVPADMSSLVAITNDSGVVKTIEVNLDRTQKIESLTVSGAKSVHFVKDTGLVAIYGKVTIDTDVYNEYGALDMFGVPLEIADGKHLTLDLTNMPIDDYYEVTHIRISGYSTEPDNPEATTHEEKKGWPLIPLFPKTKRYDFDVEYNMTDHSYYLVIYPNHTHVDDVQGNPSGFISVHDPAEAVLTQLTGRDYVLPATVNKVSVEYGKYDITKVFDGGDVGGQFFITNIVDGKVHPTLNPEASIAIDGQTISVSPVVAAVRVDGNDVAAMADGDNESVMFGVKTIPGLWYAVATSENGNNFTVDYDSIRQATGTALKLESDELHNSQKIRLFRILTSESKAELGTAKSVSDVLAYVNGTDYQGLNAHGMDIDEGAVAGFGPVVYGLKVAGSEDGDFFDDTFRSLTFNLNGTATAADGKVYALKNADGFTVATATSAGGSVTFSLGPNAIANGTLYLVAPETMLETVGVASYKWNGQETATSVNQTALIPLVMLANTPAKDGLKSVNTVLDANSDINTSNRNVGSVYRIPAIANNGTNIVAMFDCRYLNHNDLGTTWAGNSRAIDQAICESADSGLTWTSPTIAIDVPNYNNGDTGVALRECDFGDPCLGFFNHKFYVMAQTGVGLQGSDTNDNDLVMYSRDEEVGSAWGNRTSVQAAIMSALETARGEDAAYPATRGILQGPGHAIVSNDKLHFPMQYFPLKNSGNKPRVFVASLASDGTWTATKLTAGTEDAEEPSLAVLDNGDWYMIAKDGEGGQTGGRHVFVSKDHNSWTKVAKQFVGETPPVQGSMLKVGTKDGHGVYVAAMDTGSRTGDGTNDGRSDLKLFIGTDASSSDANRTYDENSVPITWTQKEDAIMIYDGYTEGQGYNSIVQIDATTIGVLFEAAKHIYFKKVDISTYVDVN